MTETDDLEKIHVDLPAHWAAAGESMWARPLDDDLFELHNTPFYAYGLNYLDVVRAEPEEPAGRPVIREVVRAGGHRTLRVVFLEPAGLERRKEILAELVSLGATWEEAWAGYVALDLAPEVDMAAVRDRLDDLEAGGFLEYETCEARAAGSFDAAAEDSE